MIKIDQCEHKNVILRYAAPQGYTVGICVACDETVVTSPVQASISELLDYNWMITHIAERIGVDRHELGNMLSQLQLAEMQR